MSWIINKDFFEKVKEKQREYPTYQSFRVSSGLHVAESTFNRIKRCRSYDEYKAQAKKDSSKRAERRKADNHPTCTVGDEETVLLTKSEYSGMIDRIDQLERQVKHVKHMYRKYKETVQTVYRDVAPIIIEQSKEVQNE